MGRDALKVVLNFFLGARGRRCVSGNLMFAFCGTSGTPINGKAGPGHASESLEGGGREACVSEERRTKQDHNACSA